MRANRLQAIELLAHGSSIEDASKSLSISRRSIHNWLNDPEFMKALEIRKKEIIERLNIRMIGLNEEALDVLEDCMRSRNETIRLRSASYLNSKLFESIELGDIRKTIERINERLDALALQRR